jgi:hypothetical protein
VWVLLTEIVVPMSMDVTKKTEFTEKRCNCELGFPGSVRNPCENDTYGPLASSTCKTFFHKQAKSLRTLHNNDAKEYQVGGSFRHTTRGHMVSYRPCVKSMADDHWHVGSTCKTGCSAYHTITLQSKQHTANHRQKSCNLFTR